MSRYTLEVTAPFAIGSKDDEGNKLASALDIIATVHGGKVVEPAPSQSSHSLSCVNIIDCENSLERDVDWLREKFPDIRFVLKVNGLTL